MKGRRKRAARGAWLVAILGVVVGSLLPAASLPMRVLNHLQISDKIQHFGAYAVLAFLPAVHERWRFIMVAGFGLMAMGYGLEVGQLYSPGRSYDLADFAADAKSPVVRVESFGGASGDGSWDQRPDYPKMASEDAAAEMWRHTDLTPRDIDVAEVYDGFTFLTLAWLEALGICGDGESGPFIEGATRIALGGELPLNTYGGQLSAGRMHGYWILHEAVLQLRHQAGARQVRGAEVAVATVGGGPIAGCMLLTR